MARIVRRKDKEPLSKLERPSSASSQTTAHIINSCFKEILTQTPLDPEAVNHLTISRRGEPVCHDGFVDGLKQFTDEYNQQLNKLAYLERHVIQARAKALAEDEKVISGLAKVCPSFQEIGLPKGPSNLHQLLDDELLSGHHLLAPSQYLPQQPSRSLPPTEGPPSYLQPTHTSTLHASVKNNLLQGPPAKHPAKLPWKNTLTPAEREADKIALTKLEHRSVYLQNPKYSSTALTNTASSGPLKLKQVQQGVEYTQGDQFFTAEPSEVLFSDYQPGSTYKACVKLKNITGASRQLRIVPLNSPYFTVTTDQFPNTDGLIAPGMYCSYTVTFNPDSLANYKDELKVLTNNGVCLSVPIQAVRPAPELTLPRLLEVGCCLAGDSVTSSIECSNLGGEGAFRLMRNNDPEKKIELTDALSVGPFSISPTEFQLPAGSSMTFTVHFEPSSIGEHLEEFAMACDNGQVLSFTLRGIAGKIDVGCIFTGESSNEGGVATLTSGSVYFLLDEDDPAISSIDESSPSVMECPCVEFSPVNPHTTAHSTVIIKNFSKMDLPFSWSFYRPITRPLQSSEAHSENEDVPLINQLVPSKYDVFSVHPSSGVFSAGEAKSFSFRFHPTKIGSFSDMAHLVLSGVHTDLGLDPTEEGVRWLRLSESDVSVVYVETAGTSQDYSIEMTPPSVLFASKLPIASETRKKIKMSNHSLSDVTYHWDGYEGDRVSISMEPPYGSIASGNTTLCELVIQAHSMGPFATILACHLELCNATFTVPIEGYVQAPIVNTSVANLNFGLIQLGRSCTLSFNLTNHSNCSINCHFRQNAQTDHQCLSVTNGTGDTCSFRLSAYGSTTVTVECHPKRVGQISSILEMLVDETHASYKSIAVLAEVQQPQVHLEKCELHIERAYVGIDSKHTVTLRNSGLISTQFTWSSQVYGASSEHCRVRISPMTDRIGPRDTVTITIDTTWNKTGSHSEAVLRCDVLGADEPLFLSLSAEVFGLSVSYQIQKPNTSNSLSDEECSSELLNLDYGTNTLGTPVDLKVIVRNNSAIPTSLEAQVTNFPASKPPTPPSHPNTGPGDPILQKRGKYLLQRTANIGDPKSRSSQQAATDYANSLLRDGHGACFLVTPSSADLPPFSTVTLTVTAYSNMWGEYTDQLVCKVTDGDSTVIPIHYSASGCPVVFQVTGTPAQTLLRFGSHLPNSKVVKRILKMRNTSPVDLRIDWTVANIMTDDSRIIDLITFFDDPFPKLNNTFMSPKVASVKATTIPTTISSTTSSSSSEEETAREKSDESLGVSSCHLINVLIKPHEGVPSDHPFGITPAQMVIPAHGQCSVILTFQPSIRALNEIGDHLASYALGHFSLDSQDPPNVTRSSGYDVEPLRVDMLANIEHAKLTLDCDEDDGLTFNLPASQFLDREQHVLESVDVIHGFTLINSSSSLLQFNCSTSTSYFTITNVSTVYECRECVTLKPQQNVTFNVVFTLTLEDFFEKARDVPSSDKAVTYEDVLQIEFTTGAKQAFPLRAIIVLSKLDISKTTIDFGKCLLGAPVSTNVTLSNTTGSSVPWSTTISPELKEVIFVDCEDGLLPSHLTNGKPSSQLLQVTFIPSHETSYQGSITLQEQITRQQQTIYITGYGSPDEQYCPQLNQ